MMILTAVCTLIAIVSSAIAWRVWVDERRRSHARVARLALEIHGTASPAGEARLRPDTAHVASPPSANIAERTDGLFATASKPATSGSHWGLALAAGAFVVASVAAAAIVFSDDSRSGAIAAPLESRVTASPAALPQPVPLELAALSHEREGDHLTVRGVVRNPASGTQMDRLTAVVFLFDRDGGFLTSGRAAVASPALIPGGESTFVVTIPATGEVGRYRVSFRSDERVISHVDKRSAS